MTARATTPCPARCPRCGGLALPDLDGLGCMACGWHSWERARQHGHGEREAREALFFGHRVSATAQTPIAEAARDD